MSERERGERGRRGGREEGEGGTVDIRVLHCLNEREEFIQEEWV